MEITFEDEREIGVGSSPSAVIMADETYRVIVSNGTLKSYKVVVDTGLIANSVIEPMVSIGSDTQNSNIEIVHYGPQNWLSWNSADKRRLALFEEAPKVMRNMFFKGFITGLFIRDNNLRVDNKVFGQVDSTNMQAKVDYNNGFLMGWLLTRGKSN